MKTIPNIPAEERTGGVYVLAALCKEDKEQLDRIEAMLKKLQPKEWVAGPK